MESETKPQGRLFSITTIAVLLLIVIVGFPAAVILDLRALAERQLSVQAGELGHIIDDLRDFYAENVVARAVGKDTPITASHRYIEEDASIPIPATFSLELVSIFSGDGDTMTYRFVSDYPFTNRPPRQLTQFERGAIDSLTQDPTVTPVEVTGGLFDRSFSIATPVLMTQSCVACHNAHPESTRLDWQVGDLRGIQAITLRQDIASNSFAFVYLTAYFALLVGSAIFVVMRMRAQSLLLADANLDLAEANEHLAIVSHKIARYISPKVYRRVFLAMDDDDVKTDRRKLTIFFSDLEGFTELSERLQPEELTEVLNTYFTEMSRIAEDHGGTLDKFIGDAILVFFGDPISNGVREDARACMRMALAMRRRLKELAAEYASETGLDWPLSMRIGINTGYCNVGNFGSEDRLAYTIIGAEVNLAARLQENCGAGEIALSEETYFLVADMAPATPAPPLEAKGIPHPVPYFVVGKEEDSSERTINVEVAGLQLRIDTAELSATDREHAKETLRAALARLGTEDIAKGGKA